MKDASPAANSHSAWNKGKLVGQKAPFKLKEIWAIRIRLQIADRQRDLALFNLAIDSKLRACDLLKLKVRDVTHGSAVASRAIVLQQKTQRPVQFEITEPTRDAIGVWIASESLGSDDAVFPSRVHAPIREDRQFMGERGRPQRVALRDPIAAAHQANADL